MPATRAARAATGLAVAMAMIASGAAPAAASDSSRLSSGELTKIKQLKDNKVVFRTAPDPAGHPYRYQTTTAFWSVVATDPGSFLDTDLRIYGDKGEGELVGESRSSGDVVDFVAIDSNHRPLDSYFPRVDTFAGEGSYYVELAQGSRYAVNGYQTVPMTDSDVVAVRDTLLEAGKAYRFVLSPGNESMRGSLFLMDSLPLTKATWVRSRSQSVASEVGTIGEAVVLDFVAPRTDRYGLVILNEGYEGTFGLHRLTF